MRHRVVSSCAIVLAISGCSSDPEPSTEIEFSNIRVEEIGAHRAAIRFQTSIPTECEIEIGKTTSFGTIAVDPDMEEGELAIDHDVPVEDLELSTVYYFRARAQDAEGEFAYSEMTSFETLAEEDPTAGKLNYALLASGTSIVDVSSNFGASNGASWGINAAFDGSMASEWSSSGDGNNAFVTINFGQQRSITSFGFRSRKMSDGTAITTKVELVHGTTTLGPFSTDDPDTRYVFPLDPAITTDTIRVNLIETTGGNTGAKEIQFYGTNAL